MIHWSDDIPPVCPVCDSGPLVTMIGAQMALHAHCGSCGTEVYPMVKDSPRPARQTWILAEKLRRIGNDLSRGAEVHPERWNEVQSGILRVQTAIRESESHHPAPAVLEEENPETD